MEKIFFIGINGIGMSGLAKIMIKKGFKIYGSDLERKEVTNELEKMGAKIFIGHNDLNVLGMDLVVYSSAIKATNPEYLFAKLNNITLMKRGELLSKIMNDEKGIAVAGTHGKTTTSSMAAVTLLDLDPTIVVGGIIREINSNSKPGNGGIVVAEADESDNSFLMLKPYYSIITNVEPDHMEFHHTFENLRGSFKKFIEQTSGEVIACIDCEALKEIVKDCKNVITYSTKDENADIYAKNIRYENNKTIFDVFIKESLEGEFKLSIPGEHNVANSLGPIYIARQLGISAQDISEKLENFLGAKRRFDIIFDQDITVVDDYAHHPTEIRETVKAAQKRTRNRVVAVYQPHRYSRIKLLLESFDGCFNDADQVIIMPIYAAGEKNIYDISSENILEVLDKKENVVCLHDSEILIRKLLDEKKEGDLILFMGAGDIYKTARNFADILKG